MKVLTSYETAVLPEWIDYNGHMSEAYYVLVFGFATDRAMVALGMDEEYRRTSGCSLYTVEAHIRYLDEVSLDHTLQVSTEIVSASEKKMHLAHTMRVGETVVATEEILALHVDQTKGRAIPMPESILERALSAVGNPANWIGRTITVTG